MSKFDFASAGFYSSNELHPRDITIGRQVYTVYVRKLPAIELQRFHEETKSPDMETRLNSGFRILAKAVRQEDGSAHMTLDEAKKLSGEPLIELLRAFTDVNKTAEPDDLGND